MITIQWIATLAIVKTTAKQVKQISLTNGAAKAKHVTEIDRYKQQKPPEQNTCPSTSKDEDTETRSVRD